MTAETIAGCSEGADCCSWGPSRPCGIGVEFPLTLLGGPPPIIDGQSACAERDERQHAGSVQVAGPQTEVIARRTRNIKATTPAAAARPRGLTGMASIVRRREGGRGSPNHSCCARWAHRWQRPSV